jgi:putative SOS response-associated peptidase YedK
MRGSTLPTRAKAVARPLVRAPVELLTGYPVAPLVNSVRNNGPELIVEATG